MELYEQEGLERITTLAGIPRAAVQQLNPRVPSWGE